MKFVKRIRVFPVKNSNKNVEIWFPVPKKSKFEVEVLIDGKKADVNFRVGDSKENIFTMLYFDIPKVIRSVSVTVQFEFTPRIEIQLPRSQTYKRLGLSKSDLYIDFEKTEITNLKYKIFSEQKNMQSTSTRVKIIRDYLYKNLKYSYNPITRLASEVANTLQSDCGGYHSLFCALLRSENIACHLLFGFRGDKNEKYHTTMVWFNGKKWVREDLNDMQDNEGKIRPFVPISIGSGIDIDTPKTPPYPRKVLHLQHSLVWIEGNPPEKVVQSFKLLK